MLTAIQGSSVRLLDGELLRRRRANRDYMMSLSDDNLLMNFRLEAGLFSADHTPAEAHGGWESPFCQLRGHFPGHWLSAAAMHYQATGDLEIKAKADLKMAFILNTSSVSNS